MSNKRESTGGETVVNDKDNQLSWDERRELARNDSKKRRKSSGVPTEYMHEDELPEDIPQADYDEWYKRSYVPDGVGCRVGPKYPWEAKQ